MATRKSESVDGSTDGTVGGNEVVKTVPLIPQQAYHDIQTFDDAVELARLTYGDANVVSASEVLGDGFKMVENKDTLIGVPFIAISWNFLMGDHGEYVAVRLVTQDNNKLVMVDGSSGVFQMLANYSKKTGSEGGLYCLKGLRRSDYTYTDESGKEKSARTYYLDVSA